MALELRQQLKLSQQLVMTPQLQQAIKLLQLSRAELLETVERELMENPMLDEKVEEEVRDAEHAEGEKKRQSSTSEEDFRQDMNRDADWEDYLGEFSSSSRQAHSRDHEIPEEGMGFESRLSASHSLQGHLMWQLRLSRLDESDVDVGEFVIGNLDERGYLQATVEDIAEMASCNREKAADVLSAIQRFDPVGVAARSPKECLLIQLDVLGYDDPVLREIVSDHIEDLEKRRYKPLARKFKLDMEKIKEYLDVLQSLDPMPGASFGGSQPQYVSPDVYVYKYEDEFVIMLNEDGLPSLQLNSFYLDNMKGAKPEEKEYFQDKMRSAVWLMKSLYQRQRTLYKVVESIVGFQRDFFEGGITHLRPLILKDVADDIEMHESTVSRITTNKFVATPHGVYELKFFFNSALGLEDGSQVGSESVKAMIKKLIDAENPKNPLSDEKIAEILKDKLKINIARRTVAKYRGALGVLSSSKRKQVF
jgi:RNA polymerase sigma-54 factor